MQGIRMFWQDHINIKHSSYFNGIFILSLDKMASPLEIKKNASSAVFMILGTRSTKSISKHSFHAFVNLYIFLMAVTVPFRSLWFSIFTIAWKRAPYFPGPEFTGLGSQAYHTFVCFLDGGSSSAPTWPPRTIKGQ